jgi:NADH-quinone oxidoreductase subunit G
LRGPARTPSLRDVEVSDAAFVLGEDVANVAPRLALALRQLVMQAPMKIADALHIPRWNDAAVREAVQRDKGPLFLAATGATRLDDIATATYRAAPDDLARLAWAVAHALDPESPGVEVGPGVAALARRIADALRAAERPVIVGGTTSGSEALLGAAANVAWALARAGRGAQLALVAPECNSLGAALLDAAGGLEGALEALARGAADTLVIVENDLFQRLESRLARALLESARHVVVLDHLLTETARRADLVLPAATFAECSGTLVSSEGRAQRYFDTFEPDGGIRASWRWLDDLMVALGKKERWASLDELLGALATAAPALAPVVAAAPPASFREVGQRVPRAPHRYSGRTAMLAQLTVHEPPPPIDADAPLAHSMEGCSRQPPPSLQPFFWSPGWNSIQALNRFQEEIGGPLRGGDSGVRLIEPGPASSDSAPPPPFAPRPGQWLIVPAYSIFGSEELSLHSPGVAERAPAPYLSVHPDDAGTIGALPDDRVLLTMDDRQWELALQVSPAQPRGVAAVLIGPETRGLDLPAWGAVARR